MPLTQVARQFLFVRETKGPNRGVWVEIFLKYVDLPPGLPWCAAFLCFCLSIYYAGLSPLAKSGSCDDLLDQCTKQGWLVDDPQPGDLYFYINSPTDAHHVGVVTEVVRVPDKETDLYGIAGNTSADGHSDNGDRVAEHRLDVPREKMRFARLP